MSAQQPKAGGKGISAEKWRGDRGILRGSQNLKLANVQSRRTLNANEKLLHDGRVFGRAGVKLGFARDHHLVLRDLSGRGLLAARSARFRRLRVRLRGHMRLRLAAIRLTGSLLHFRQTQAACGSRLGKKEGCYSGDPEDCFANQHLTQPYPWTKGTPVAILNSSPSCPLSISESDRWRKVEDLQ